MKSLLGLCAAALALASSPACAAAGAITYDCDTAAEHFSELVLPTPAGAFVVTGNVKLSEVAPSKRYVPAARVHIGSSSAPGQPAEAFAGFSIMAMATDPKKAGSGPAAVQMLSWNASGRKDEGLPFSLLVEPGTVQPFRLSYDGSQVSVTLGSESRSFPLKTPDPMVRIVCSTGEFLFTDLTIQPQ